LLPAPIPVYKEWMSSDDFIWEDLLHIKIKSKAEEEQERDRLKLDRIARYPQEIAEAQSEGKKRKVVMLQRNRMRDIWEPEDRVMKMYWYTVDELKAMDKYKILNFSIQKKYPINSDIVQEWLRIDDIDEEHEVYIEYYQTLPEWDIKRKAIQMRYDAIIQLNDLKNQSQMQMQWQEQSWATSWAANSAASMWIANQMWKSRDLATTEDVIW